MGHTINRDYDPATGRWLSKDPIGISGGLNQYVFCANNPVNFVDPFGLCEDIDDKDLLDALRKYLVDRKVGDTKVWTSDGAMSADTERFKANKLYRYNGSIYGGHEVNYIAEGAYIAHTKGYKNIPLSGVMSVFYHNGVHYHHLPSKGKWIFYFKGKELYRDYFKKRNNTSHPERRMIYFGEF